MDWMQIIVSVLSGLCVCIPLVYQLVRYVTDAVKARRWDELMKLVIANMAEAERLYSTGAERKEWVMGMLSANAAKAGYDLKADDVAKVSDMIDKLCDMSKIVNGAGND